MKPFAIQLLALDIDGVLTDGRVLFNAGGQEQKSVSYLDMDAIFEAHSRGLPLALVTGEDTPWVDFISRRLQIKHVVRGAKDKLEAIRKLGENLRVPLSAIGYVGDCDRDAPALSAVGLGMAPANGTPAAKAAARVVLQAAGGGGAIREATDYLWAEEGPFSDTSIPATRHFPAQEPPAADAFLRRVESLLEEASAVQRVVAENLAAGIARAARVLSEARENQKKIFLFDGGGNGDGGRSTTAELVTPYGADPQGVRADPPLKSGRRGNHGKEANVFSEIPVSARAGDVLLILEARGDSDRLRRAARAAKEKEMKTIAITAGTEPPFPGLIDLHLAVPAKRPAGFREVRRFVLQMLCRLLDLPSPRPQAS